MLPTTLLRAALLLLLGSAMASAQINPNACKQVREDDVATLLTLNQSTVETSQNSASNRCVFEVATPVSDTRSELELTIRKFDSHAEAVAYMKNEFPFYFDKHPPLVKTTGADDHVDTVLTNNENGIAEAVHENVMSRVNISRIEQGARAHPTFEYRLQRLALQAAGATVLPAIGLAADPVRPRAVDDSPTQSGTNTSSPFTNVHIIESLVALTFLLLWFRVRRVSQAKS